MAPRAGGIEEPQRHLICSALECSALVRDGRAHAKVMGGQVDIDEYRIITKSAEGSRGEDRRGRVVDDTARRVGRTHGPVRGTTEAVTAERARRESEERWRHVLEATPDAMVIADERGQIMLVNAQTERLFGYPREELVGRPVETLLPPAARARHVRHRAAYLAEPRVRLMGAGMELFGRRKDGSVFPVEISVSALVGHDETIVIAAVRDITARRRVEEEIRNRTAELERRLQERSSELAHANAELDQFAYVAAHDLQEPLRAVASYSQLLERRYKGRLDADADKFIERITGAVGRMQQLIQDLLAYFRVGPRARKQPTAAEAVLQCVLDHLHAAIADSGAVVTHDALPTVLADGSQLAQVFENLIDNAIKFRGGEPPRIHVSARAQGTGWVFSVRDNGIGLDPGFAERIFVIFQRLHTRTEYPGTGAGLAICKKCVEGHGGRIWVESQPGRGATFVFTIPGKGDPQAWTAPTGGV